ncbi:uncharacterized protein LOC126317458 [Schistocerca gregaria]|uniref:uncharacterized protein LOC126317458 n=1 Tax=Schistocerca gregaria TaxID=7010 RepID=UPI00211E8E85|nr:uncharacterized protein LOC126317458 [Schistocerca gregaria]
MKFNLDAFALVYMTASTAALWIDSDVVDIRSLNTVTLWEHTKNGRLSLFLMSNFYLALLILAFRFTQWAAFGELTELEAQKLYQRFVYLLFDVLLVPIIFDPSLDVLVKWCFWILTITAMKLLCYLTQLRLKSLVNYAPNVDWWISFRMSALLVVLFVSNISWMASWYEVLRSSIDRECWIFAFFVVFNFYVIILQTFTKYGIYFTDVAFEGNNWVYRSSYFYYMTDLSAKCITLFVSFVNYSRLLWTTHSDISYLYVLLIVTQILMLVTSLVYKIRAYLKYRRLTSELDCRYPRLDSSHLSADENCTICLSSMKDARLLPCQHTFHESCLRSWLQYNHTCPSCRYELMASFNRKSVPVAAAPPPQPPSLPPTPPPLPRGRRLPSSGFCTLLRITSPSMTFLPQLSLEIVKEGSGIARLSHASG